MISSTLSGNDYAISQDNHPEYVTVDNVSSIVCNDPTIRTYITNSTYSTPSINLQKSNGQWISVDDLVTKQECLSTDFLWESLFLAICNENPKSAPEYMTMLKLYNNDYKQTVLAIELQKSKED